MSSAGNLLWKLKYSYLLCGFGRFAKQNFGVHIMCRNLLLIFPLNQLLRIFPHWWTDGGIIYIFYILFREKSNTRTYQDCGCLSSCIASLSLAMPLKSMQLSAHRKSINFFICTWINVYLVKLIRIMSSDLVYDFKLQMYSEI